MKKVIISGGGTGGHIYPAIAIANQLKIKYKDQVEILFIGANGKMEMEKVPKAGYSIIGLPISGIQRNNIFANFSFPFKLAKSLFKAFSEIKKFEPDAVIGVGGFASGPTLLMANFLGIKTYLQEQNSYAGLTNKKLAKKAEKICVAYPNMQEYFPKDKIVFTGNPIRNDLLNLEGKKEMAMRHFGLNPNKSTLLVIGGSLGAKSINNALEKNLNTILKNDVQLIWQTGKNFDSSEILKQKLEGVYISEFIYEMDLAYAAADVCISRAGALSISEISVVGLPSVLVPYPFAAEDHQTKNAKSLADNNAAIFVKDDEASDNLVNEALELLKNKERQKTFKINLKEFARPNASQEIVDLINL